MNYHFIVGPADAGDRADRYLAAKLAKHSRTYLQKLMEEGRIQIDGRPADPAHKMRAGEVVEVHTPAPKPIAAQPEELPLDIVYEDEHLLVLNKPAGMVVHPAPGHEGGTLVNALLHHCKNLPGISGALRPGIVHRLDKGTSGLMLVAKSEAAHRALVEQFKRREIEKGYLAFVIGSPPKKQGTIRSTIGRDRQQRKKISSRTTIGRLAVTHYRVQAQGRGLSLLEIGLETGRTHQVRVHLSELGHPLVGDTLYGARSHWSRLKDPEVRTAVEAFSRPALHAAQLKLLHPIDKKELKFEIDMPSDLNSLLKMMRGGS